MRSLTPERDLVPRIGGGYQLNFGKYSCDVVRFEEVLQTARQQLRLNFQAARELLGEALRLRKHGKFLEADLYDDTVRKRRLQLENQLREFNIIMQSAVALP